ncbi:MAG: IclR family transcriptional regulator [Candidatus Dormibacteria bacterium]
MTQATHQPPGSIHKISAAAPRGSLARGLTLLSELAAYPDGLSLTELARLVQLPPSTVHRLLATNRRFGFVSYDVPTRHYSLGLKLLQLSHHMARLRSLSEVSTPLMHRLSDTVRETALLASLYETDVVFVARTDAQRTVTIHGDIGDRAPAYCTATGKVLLASLPRDELSELLPSIHFKAYTPRTATSLSALQADLDEVSHLGYALSDEEYDEGVISLAVPVRGRDGRAIAGLCISAPSYRMSRSALVGHLGSLRDTAVEIALRVG